MSAATPLARCKFLTLSFSGAGHLLPYHLGVATAIKHSTAKPIHAAAGSSSGAIAAALFVYFPNYLIKEYADRFISDGGRAMYHFKKMMKEYEPSTGNIEMESNANSLHIATTRCSDGSLHLFDFPSKLSSVSNKEHLLKCLEASCKIPPYFHPSDILPNKWPSTYPEDDGVCIGGSSYVDGGISAPAPPTPHDSAEGACRIVISPIAGGNNESNAIRVSPSDHSWKFPLDLKCRGGFCVHPSVQNIKAMQISAGVASPAILQEWFERGVEDGNCVFKA